MNPGLERVDSRTQTPQSTTDLLREDSREGVHWKKVLVWFMRLLSTAWLLKGVAAWAVILGLTTGPVPFEDATIGFQSAMIYFAVIDLVAAVGLWLTSNWGGVLWMLAVMSHLIIAVFFPRFVANSTLIISLFILAIMAYLTVSWLAAMEDD